MKANVRLLRYVQITCLVALVFVCAANAQQRTGAIVGTVFDTSHAAVPGATVTARHVATGVDVEVTSSGTGTFAFPALTIGEYSVRASAAGFKATERPQLRVVSGETITLELELSVGELSETVTVTDELPPVDFTRTTAGAAQTSETIRDLPLQVAGSSRRSLDFLATMPGVTYVPNSGAIVQGTGDSGPHRNAVMFSIDGQIASVNFSQGLRDDTGPVPDLIEEFRLVANQNAEHGWTQGTGVELITKSGTNAFHGTVYEYLRNDALDARGFIAPSVPPQKQHEYGVVIHGPIVRNKHFFIASWDGFKRRTSSAALVRTVPTALMRNGDFSESLGAQIATDVLGRPVFKGQIYDPLTTRSDGKGGFIRDPFENNVIPGDRFSPVSQRYQGFLPVPTRPGLQQNWVGLGGRNVIDRDRTYIKTDHILGSHTISFGWEYTPRDKSTTTPSIGWEQSGRPTL